LTVFWVDELDTRSAATKTGRDFNSLPAARFGPDIPGNLGELMEIVRDETGGVGKVGREGLGNNRFEKLAIFRLDHKLLFPGGSGRFSTIPSLKSHCFSSGVSLEQIPFIIKE